MPVQDSPNEPAPVAPKPDTVVLVLQEMLIDIFGIMIPGFCYIVLTFVALVPPLIAMRTEVCCGFQHTGFEDFLSKNAVVIFVTFVIFSFVAGHLLYRQNPKAPDQKSIDRCWNDIKKSGCVRVRRNECDEFPYGHIKEYLEERGFDDLASLVPWTGADFQRDENDGAREINARKRSKHFINTIKLSIKQRDSRMYFDIQRNEAHVRLISSVWYGSRALIPVSGAGIFVALERLSVDVNRNNKRVPKGSQIKFELLDSNGEVRRWQRDTRTTSGRGWWRLSKTARADGKRRGCSVSAPRLQFAGSNVGRHRAV